MLEWLIPISVFWLAAALYLGGMDVEVEGGSGFQQLLGLLVTFALFLAVWAGLRIPLGGFIGVLGRVVLPTLISVSILPLISRVAFRLVGVRVHAATGDH